MCQVLVQYHVYCATNWERLIIQIIATIIIHIYIVQFIRIHIHHWKPQRPHAIVHHHRNQHPCRTHTVGHHHIRSTIFWPVFIIQPLCYVEPVRPSYKPCQRPLNIKYRRALSAPNHYSPLNKSRTTPIIICTCKIIAYHCIKDMAISKLPATYNIGNIDVDFSFNLACIQSSTDQKCLLIYNKTMKME